MQQWWTCNQQNKWGLLVKCAHIPVKHMSETKSTNWMLSVVSSVCFTCARCWRCNSRKTQECRGHSRGPRLTLLWRRRPFSPERSAASGPLTSRDLSKWPRRPRDAQRSQCRWWEKERGTTAQLFSRRERPPFTLFLLFLLLFDSYLYVESSLQLLIATVFNRCSLSLRSFLRLRILLISLFCFHSSHLRCHEADYRL